MTGSALPSADSQVLFSVVKGSITYPPRFKQILTYVHGTMIYPGTSLRAPVLRPR